MKKYNIILLLIDGARIDRLFQFPIFKKLKEEGCFFSEMIASAPYTLVAMNSIFTGMYGSKNGIDAYHKIFYEIHHFAFLFLFLFHYEPLQLNSDQMFLG